MLLRTHKDRLPREGLLNGSHIPKKCSHPPVMLCKLIIFVRELLGECHCSIVALPHLPQEPFLSLHTWNLELTKWISEPSLLGEFSEETPSRLLVNVCSSQNKLSNIWKQLLHLKPILDACLIIFLVLRAWILLQETCLLSYFIQHRKSSLLCLPSRTGRKRTHLCFTVETESLSNNLNQKLQVSRISIHFLRERAVLSTAGMLGGIWGTWVICPSLPLY